MATFTSEQLTGAKVIQLGYTVDDMEKAARHWAITYGAGPFFLFDEAPISGALTGKGEPTTIGLGAAVGQWGSVQIELMQWRVIDDAHISSIMTAPGFNHVAYFSEDSAAEAAKLAADGIPVLASLKFGTTPVYWHDGRATSGHLVEHFPRDEAIEGLFRTVAEAAIDWDGADPIRRLS